MKRLGPSGASLAATFLLVVAPRPLPAQCAGFIVHAWEWQYSINGLGGETLTPETEGYTRQLDFQASGIMFEYRDQRLVGLHEWSAWCYAVDATETVLTYDNDPESQFDAWTEVLPDGRHLGMAVHGLADGLEDHYIERGTVQGTEETTWGAVKALYGGP